MKAIALVFGFIVSLNSIAQCSIVTNNRDQKSHPQDALYVILSSPYSCPQDVIQLRDLLKEMGLSLTTTLVANEGFHHPNNGSFSLFEMAKGTVMLKGNPITLGDSDLFFGHFTKAEHNQLMLDQTPDANKLMIEAIAWDDKKGAYNFYELRGDGQQGLWYYRGDSFDIYQDNKLLHRQATAKTVKFGNRLRCSGCHGNGGPIMKELSNPHNDWWTKKRPLSFGKLTIDNELQQVLTTLHSASELAKSTKNGNRKLLDKSHVVMNADRLTLQEQLRPLFCPVELNLASEKSIKKDKVIKIPSDFFIDRRLLPNKRQMFMPTARKFYTQSLRSSHSHFPQTNKLDADHAWLTPVKADSDVLWVEQLTRKGIITEKFVADVLAIDMTNPVFSAQRCGLLQYVPNEGNNNWLSSFIDKLATSDNLSAHLLAKNLLDPQKTKAYYQTIASHYLHECRIKLHEESNLNKLYHILLQRRVEIEESEISKNPLGQILEPGFRVIFPTTTLKIAPHQFSITLDCNVLPKAQETQHC